MKDKTIGALCGMSGPHIAKIFARTWWVDWGHPLVLSLLGALIGLIVMHYGKRLLNSFDNWRVLRKLGKYKDNGRSNEN